MLKVLQLKIIKRNKKQKKQFLDSYSCMTVFMAPSSKIPLLALLVTSSSDNHSLDWHVSCKACNRSANVWGAGENIGCALNPAFSSSVCSINSNFLTKPNRYSLFLQALVQFTIFSLLNSMLLNASQSPVQWLQLGPRPEFRKVSWHVSNFLQKKLDAQGGHRARLLLSYIPYENVCVI